MNMSGHVWKSAAALIFGLSNSTTIYGQGANTFEQDTGPEGFNLLGVFAAPETANHYLDELRARVADAGERGNQADKEGALADLGRSASDYASVGDVPAARRTLIRREALNAFLAAAELALADGRVRYTQKVASLAFELGDRALLDKTFQTYLTNFVDEKGRYLALNDYGSALVKFGDDVSADRYFLDAIAMRPDPDEGSPLYRAD